MPYFPRSEYERQKEYEESKKAEHIEQKRFERKDLAKREKQNQSSNSKLDILLDTSTCSNNKSESNHSLEELRILKNVLTNNSGNYQQQYGPSLVKRR